MASAPAPDGPKRAALSAVLAASPSLAGNVRTATGEGAGFAVTGWPLGRLSSLAPQGLARGQVVSVHGSAQLVLDLAGAVSAGGGWCALVGQPDLARAGLAAAAAGVDLNRWILVPEPGTQWLEAAATLIAATDLVVVAPAGPVSANLAGRLASRARQHGTVVIAYTATAWPNADLVINADPGPWQGLGDGHGLLAGGK
jgi:hypothetical protein